MRHAIERQTSPKRFRYVCGECGDVGRWEIGGQARGMLTSHLQRRHSRHYYGNKAAHAARYAAPGAWWLGNA